MPRAANLRMSSVGTPVFAEGVRKMAIRDIPDALATLCETFTTRTIATLLGPSFPKSCVHVTPRRPHPGAPSPDGKTVGDEVAAGCRGLFPMPSRDMPPFFATATPISP